MATPPRTINVASSLKGGNGESDSGPASSSKGGGQCLCSPTTHSGSFRCKFHRSLSSTWTRRSKSMSGNSSPPSISPKSVEST
uniref:Serine-rich protein-like protein n=1 Tax=Nelumbo nucifera TaxID=4432 RepID=A0A822ZJI5_NELNU|nr:TPA_asm: hypothetical protein HUJ06_002940 [Nelumbo nucifera]